MSYHLIEPCAGSAAVTFALLGAKRAVVPYQGSKWRFRKAIIALMEELGFVGAPSKVTLTDPGPWGTTLRELLARGRLACVIQALISLGSLDPKELYWKLNGKKTSETDFISAAEHLYLQRLSHSGKAVGIRDGKWSSPGFNRTSAYGTPATERFGEVKPMIPSLIRRLETLQTEIDWDTRRDINASRQIARSPILEIIRPTIVYIDPPYMDTTPYPNGILERRTLRRIANEWADRGATVIVSEADPLNWPRWESKCIASPSNGDAPFRSKNPEYLTYRTPK